MERLLNIDCDPGQLSALNLAFVGDTVFDLFVRESLVCGANRPVKKQHTLAASRVKAAAQAAAAKALLGHLTPEEADQFRRGRNAHVHAIPKNATHGQYAKATGLEALLGSLYLSGQLDRIEELFSIGWEAQNAL